MKCCYDVSEAVVLDHFANFRDSVQPFLDKSFKDFASVRLWKFSAVKGEPEVQVKKNELNAQWTDLQGRTDKSVQILIPDVKLDSTFYAAAHRTFKAYEQIPTTDRCEEKDEYKASKNVKQMMVSLNVRITKCLVVLGIPLNVCVFVVMIMDERQHHDNT